MFVETYMSKHITELNEKMRFRPDLHGRSKLVTKEKRLLYSNIKPIRHKINKLNSYQCAGDNLKDTDWNFATETAIPQLKDNIKFRQKKRGSIALKRASLLHR